MNLEKIKTTLQYHIDRSMVRLREAEGEGDERLANDVDHYVDGLEMAFAIIDDFEKGKL